MQNSLLATPVTVGTTGLAVSRLRLLVVVVAGSVETTTEVVAGRGRAGSALGGTVDLDGTSLELLLVQGVDGVLGSGIISEGDEAETAGATCLQKQLKK